MKNNVQTIITRVIALFLFVQLAYILYTNVPSILFTFDSQLVFLYLAIVLDYILLAITSIGIYKHKKWAIVTFWGFLIIPFALQQTLGIMFPGFNSFLAINILLALFITIVFLKTSRASINSD